MAQDKMYEIHGKVTNFNGVPIDSVTIRLMNNKFEAVYETLSNEDGDYLMNVKEGDYYCLYAIRLRDYRVRKLEYWNWNVPVHQNMTINPQYDRMEIYGINAFEPQVTPQETYMIYFRPMSLSKSLQLVSDQKIEKKSFEDAERTEELLDKSDKLINISPDSITQDELTIEINGMPSKIVGINKIREYARGFFMYGYCVQVLKPKQNNEALSGYDLISVTLNSAETGEIGKGEAFVRR
ncbi:hypothetical protein NT017_19880 [Prolixibacter sp. NT017]|nr:hypothetical protein NT017_19880 [Prolixibacter sp. NT017]